jgi:hypothetical protein
MWAIYDPFKIIIMAKYSKRAGEKVEQAMHERKRGELKSGSGKKVTSRKQAIAIGLSEAREEGAKVPKKSSSGRGGTKAAAKKTAAKKSPAKKSTARKTAAKKGTSSPSRTSSSGRKAASGGRSGSTGRSTKSAGGRKPASKTTSRGGGKSRSRSSK